MNTIATLPFSEAVAQAKSIKELLPLRFYPGGIRSEDGLEKYLDKMKCLVLSEAIKATNIGELCFHSNIGVPWVDGLVGIKQTILELKGADIPEFEPSSEQVRQRLLEVVDAALQEILDRQKS